MTMFIPIIKAVPIRIREINGTAEQTVDLRDIHTYLKIQLDFDSWAIQVLVGYDHDADFLKATVKTKFVNTNFSPATIEYQITLPVAIAVVTRADAETDEILSYLVDAAGYLEEIKAQQRKYVLFGRYLQAIAKGFLTGQVLEQHQFIKTRVKKYETTADFFLSEYDLVIQFIEVDEDSRKRLYHLRKDQFKVILEPPLPTIVIVREEFINQGINQILRHLLKQTFSSSAAL